MSTEIKRGSSGGAARAEKLTKEQRKSIASAAAKARWAKKKEVVPQESASIAPVEPIPDAPTPVEAPTPQPSQGKRQKAKRRAPVPKAFGAAHSYAEKRLAEAIRERAEAAGRVAALNAEIPSLLQIIKALKSTDGNVPFQNPEIYQASERSNNYPPQGVDPYQTAATVPQPVASMPPVPMAQGGAIGGVINDQADLPEDYFLRDNIGGRELLR